MVKILWGKQLYYVAFERTQSRDIYKIGAECVWFSTNDNVSHDIKFMNPNAQIKHLNYQCPSVFTFIHVSCMFEKNKQQEPIKI